MRAALFVVLVLGPFPLGAQRWVSGAELELVREASVERKAQAADTALASWRATAHGLVRLGPVTEPGSVANVVPAKADELAVTIYGRLPDRVKQVITNWSDTILVPTAGAPRYHRDHLGIVSSDFGDRIRLGDGDEVRDLIHPLSVEGLGYYEFALGDTLRITTAREVVLVVPVSVRPRDPRSPGTVGTLYIDPDRRALVRFRFTFTPESYRDPSVRDITVTLESALLSSTHWLPSRQSIVIRRVGRANGMLRADWEIGDYVLGDRADSLFRQGPDSFPAVGGLRAQRGSLSGDTTLNTVLSRTPLPDDGVRTTAAEASDMVGGRSLEGARRRRVLLGNTLSLNRVQGYALDPGLAIPLRRSLTLTLAGGYGFSDHRAIGLVRLEGAAGQVGWRLEGERAMQDVGDVRQVEGVLGILVPLTFGRDPGDWTLLSRGTLGIRLPLGPYQFTLDGGVERSESVVAHRALRNDGRANPALGAGTATVARLGIGRRWPNENQFGARVEIGRGDANWERVVGNITLHQPLPSGRAVLSLSGGAGSRGLPGYRNFVLSDPSTLPGWAPRLLGGRSMAVADLSYERAFSLLNLIGRRPQGRPGILNTVAPFINVGMAGGDEPRLPWRGERALATTVGVRFNIGGVVFPFGVVSKGR